MSKKTGREIEYINGSAKILMDDYNREADAIRSQLPQATEHEVLPNNATLIANMEDDNRRRKLVDEACSRELESLSTTPTVRKEKRKYTTVSDEVRRVITNMYKNSNGKMNIKEMAKNFGIKEDTLRRFRRKLEKGESIERSKVRRGRHTKITPDVAAKLNKMFLDKSVHSDAEASAKLKESGINVSREAIQRAMTDGLMEKYGFQSLTMQRVYYRGDGAESPKNKERRKVVVSKLNEYMKRGYHPVFVDETHWSIGWAWNRQRGIKGEKIVVENKCRSYSITAISSITEVGPGYTLVLESSSVSAATFTSYMTRLLNCNPEEKEVYFMDNASVHRKKDLIPLVHSVKNKEILFNAPYSPDINPIETFFSIWKRNVEAKCKVAPSPRELVGIIEDTFSNIPPYECLDLINHVRKDITDDVLNGKDM